MITVTLPLEEYNRLLEVAAMADVTNRLEMYLLPPSPTNFESKGWTVRVEQKNGRGPLDIGYMKEEDAKNLHASWKMVLIQTKNKK